MTFEHATITANRASLSRARTLLARLQRERVPCSLCRTARAIRVSSEHAVCGTCVPRAARPDDGGRPTPPEDPRCVECRTFPAETCRSGNAHVALCWHCAALAPPTDEHARLDRQIAALRASKRQQDAIAAHCDRINRELRGR